MANPLYRFFLKRFPRLGGVLWRLLGGELREIVHGQGNHLEANGARLSSVELDIIGDDNHITIGAGSVVFNLKIRIRGSGHRIEIGPNCRISRGALLWFEDQDCRLEIGAGTTMVDVVVAVTEPGSQVMIGKECMFANDIDIRTGDSHAILDAATGERINPARNIIIGDHVWVAAHVVLLKGVEIGHDSVIATGAIVTRSCQPGTILAGNPAAGIKEGITWRRDRNQRGPS
ncbi:MAG: acyltransferase [Anaerolineales bacterium]|nr:acyltransferase [Anaerolineales bacterium]